MIWLLRRWPPHFLAGITVKLNEKRLLQILWTVLLIFLNAYTGFVLNTGTCHKFEV